eukprot:COSAG02_NODE_40494_length_405_cov_0.330065_1_plen_109_part_01
MVAAGGRWLRRALTPTQGTGYALAARRALTPTQGTSTAVPLLRTRVTHFFTVWAGSLSPPTQVAHASRIPLGDLTQSAQQVAHARACHCLSNRIPLSAGWRLQAIFRVG